MDSRRFPVRVHQRFDVKYNTCVQKLDDRLRYSCANVSHSELKPVDYPSYHGSSRSIMRCHARLLPISAAILQSVVLRSPLKARRLQITGVPTSVPSCRDVKLWSPSHLQLSRPPTPASLSALDLLKSSADALSWRQHAAALGFVCTEISSTHILPCDDYFVSIYILDFNLSDHTDCSWFWCVLYFTINSIKNN